VYNRVEKYSRPMTAPSKQNWLKAFDKLQPVDEEESVIDNRLPEFKNKEQLNLLSRGQVDGYRLEQIKEIESIKDRLARDHCPQSMVTLQRAVLIPEEVEYNAGERKYPGSGFGLMANPFPKKKKKKKGKKKKKSKK
jgi:hypothetical protein